MALFTFDEQCLFFIGLFCLITLLLALLFCCDYRPLMTRNFHFSIHKKFQKILVTIAIQFFCAESLLLILAGMAFFNAKFDDIRMFLSIQGYQLNHQYIIREIGFWSQKINGVIPFNCKLNLAQIDSTSEKNIHIAENEYHGIRLRKILSNALPSSDASAVIKCLYHLTKRDDYDADYIGISKEENIAPIIFKAGLGKFILEIDYLDIFQKASTKLFTLTEIKYLVTTDPIKYKPCSLHENLRNNALAVCAKAKCDIIVGQIMKINNQIQNQQQQQQLQPANQPQQQQNNCSHQVFPSPQQTTYQNNELYTFMQP